MGFFKRPLSFCEHQVEWSSQQNHQIEATDSSSVVLEGAGGMAAPQTCHKMA